MVNTTFLNNAIGKVFDPKQFDLNKINVKVLNMSETMLDLLRESIKTAILMYSSFK